MDIVERLRTEAPTYVLIGDAAIEIERLREALSAIAVSYYKDMPDGVDAKIMWVGCTEIARAALQQKDSE